jgi:hypothetical protein
LAVVGDQDQVDGEALTAAGEALGERFVGRGATEALPASDREITQGERITKCLRAKYLRRDKWRSIAPAIS